MASSTIEFGALVTGLGGGLALFLFGMRQMTESLKTVAGNSMKNLLARLTANRFTAAIAGTIITAVSPSTIDVLRTIHEKVCWAFERALDALRDGNQSAAHEAVESKTLVNELSEKATFHLAKRLIAFEPNRVAAFTVETDIIENLKRINTLTRRIARVLIKNRSTADIEVSKQDVEAKPIVEAPATAPVADSSEEEKT